MGLWDYDDDNVEEYKYEEASSSSCESEPGEDAGKTKQGRKKQQKAASRKRVLPIAQPTRELEDEHLGIDKPICLDSDSDDDFAFLETKKAKVSKPEPAKPANLTPTSASPGEDDDDEALLALKKSNEMLEKLNAAVDSDPDSSPEPACRRYTSFVPTAFQFLSAPAAQHSTAAAAQPNSGAVDESQPTTTEPSGSAAAAGLDDGPKIVVILQSKLHGRIKMRCSLQKPLSKLINTFQEHAQKQGWIKPGQAIKLMFDGDVVDPNESAQDLEMEDDYTLDWMLSC